MKIFTDKLPRTWKSSGVTLKSNQIEMSNFSFLEDYFISNSKNFNITIIGKNIIGNGVFSISVYKESSLVWQEDFSFMGISFSKKQIQIKDSYCENFKIVISRGKKSKGKILLNQVFIYQEKNKEDEPTFFFENSEIIIQKQHKEVVIASNKVATEEPITEVPTLIKKKVAKRKAKYIKIRFQKEEVAVSESPQSPAEDDSPSTTENESTANDPAKRKPKDTWITIIDFDINNDERSVFNYLNQISFGRGRQIFFVKQSSAEPIDFSKYDYVKVFFNDEDIVNELEFEWPKKITFIKKITNKFKQ
jgi:hypothetical protein